MLTPEEDVKITSLKARGWTISAIARHVGHDRKTIWACLSGEREPGVRVKQEPHGGLRTRSPVTSLGRRRPSTTSSCGR